MKLLVWLAILGALLGPGVLLCEALQVPGNHTEIPEVSDTGATAWHYGSTYGIPIAGTLAAVGGFVDKQRNQREGNMGVWGGLATGVIIQFIPGMIGGSQKVAPALAGALPPLAPWYESIWQGLTLQTFCTDALSVALMVGVMAIMVTRMRCRRILG